MLRSAVLVVALLAATLVFPATHKVPEEEALVTIEIPDEWQTKQVGERLQATAPDDPVHVMVVPPEGVKIAETMGETMRYIRGTGGIVVRADSEKRERGKLNDMGVRNFSWQAKDKAGEIKIEFSIVSLAPRRSVLIAVWGSSKAQEKHEAQLKKILQSIRGVAEHDHETTEQQDQKKTPHAE